MNAETTTINKTATVQTGFNEKRMIRIEITVETCGADGDSRVVSAKAGDAVSSAVLYKEPGLDGAWREVYREEKSRTVEEAVKAAAKRVENVVSWIVQEKVSGGAKLEDMGFAPPNGESERE